MFQLEKFYLAKFFTQPAVVMVVTNIKYDTVLLYLGCILSAEKIDKIWKGSANIKYKHKIRLKMCVLVEFWAWERLTRDKWRWVGTDYASPVDKKCGRALKNWTKKMTCTWFLFIFCISKPIMAHQLTRRVGGAEKLDKIDAYYLNLLILFYI